MNPVLAFLSLMTWLLVVPLCTGLLFNFILPRHRRTVAITFILGFLIYISVFELVAISSMLTVVFSAFSYCTYIFMAISLLMALGGIIRSVILLTKRDMHFLTLFPGEDHGEIRDYLNPRADLKLFKHHYSLESRVYWGIFFVLMALQMVMSVVMASFDGDDAYYVVESLLAQQADVMNTILPYTGSSTSLDIRHALAVITMWIAYLARMSGIHATIVSHTIMPLFIIPFVYLVYVEIARILFRDRQQVTPVFMVVTALLMMFGNVSIYTPATFFLMRTWQGKALVANLVFPMIFWMFLWMIEEIRAINELVIREGVFRRYDIYAGRRLRVTPWIMLGMICMFSGVCSSLGVIFGSALIGLLTLVLLFLSKRWTVLVGAFFCIIPNLVYLAIYFSLFQS